MICVGDMPRPGQIGFQSSATPIMEGIIGLHNTIFFFMVIIFFFVFYLLVTIFVEFVSGFYTIENPRISAKNFMNQSFRNFSSNFVKVFLYRYRIWNQWTHNTPIEIVWTTIPAFVLVAIAVPSFVLLYSMDAGASDPFSITIKVIGHQWYWAYQFPESSIATTALTDLTGNVTNVDSYMVLNEEFIKNPTFPRLLEARPALWLPINRYIRFIVTSVDVIHSWAVPSLGVKIDAIPGRINQIFALIKRPGIFYGQCSEICGINHGFMPIKIVATPCEGIDSLKFITTGGIV